MLIYYILRRHAVFWLVAEDALRHTGQRQSDFGERIVTDYVFAPPPMPSVAVQGVEARFPVRRVFCVGRNYEAHAEEMGVRADREAPFYFTKSAHMVMEAPAGQGGAQPYPPGTENYHHEMELVVALGRTGFRVAVADALDLVFGYACGLDMTRRDLQKKEREKQRPWDLGKDVENAAVMGAIVPVAACGHPAAGRISLTLNGDVRQDQDLADMIWSVPELIAHLSGYYHLQPGDLIYTGTPAGVGPVVAGDVLVGAIDGLPGIELRIGDPE